MISCPNCRSVNALDSVFCTNCGASLTPPQEAISHHPGTISPTTPLKLQLENYGQLNLLSDGEPVLNKRDSHLHNLWLNKNFGALLTAWEKKVADAERNAAKGTGWPIALIIIGIIALGGFVGIIILIAGLVVYSRRTSARKNIPEYRGVLFYLRDYVSKYGIASTTNPL